MKAVKMLATIVYAASWVACIIPITHYVSSWDHTATMEQVEKQNEILSEIERDGEELPQVEKNEDVHCNCDHPNHDYQDLSICDEIYGIYDYDDELTDEVDPSAFDSGDYSREEIEKIDKRLGL